MELFAELSESNSMTTAENRVATSSEARGRKDG